MKLADHYQLVQTALDYLGATVLSESSVLDEELRAHYQKLRTDAAELYQQKKLAQLKRWFRDISAPALATDATGFAAYVKKATGLTIDVKSDFEQRIEHICKRKRIRTEEEYYEVKTMIDALDPTAPADEDRLQLLYDLVAEHEGLIQAKDVDKPRKRVKVVPPVMKEVVRALSPDGTKALTITERSYEQSPEWTGTQVMLEFLSERSGSGVSHYDALDLGMTAYWKGNNTLVVELGKAPFDRQCANKLHYCNGDTVNITFIANA
ncbi:hypothetical protein LRS06_24880 [Hymenobacter sp. J193]|uniref:hypothetical protein n=1 Tax=Hymenobacter sp. J193 TaxID=2898429 RepID=UPI002150949E|nr:hypothetical protein [Hymenobacter sp. J193]MCR5890962.1 hypothetical protein [Hymenobacter sp. J193]